MSIVKFDPFTNRIVAVHHHLPHFTASEREDAVGFLRQHQMTPDVLGHGLTSCLMLKGRPHVVHVRGCYALHFFSDGQGANCFQCKGFSASSVDQDSAELVPTSDRPASCVPHSLARRLDRGCRMRTIWDIRSTMEWALSTSPQHTFAFRELAKLNTRRTPFTSAVGLSLRN